MAWLSRGGEGKDGGQDKMKHEETERLAVTSVFQDGRDWWITSSWTIFSFWYLACLHMDHSKMVGIALRQVLWRPHFLFFYTSTHVQYKGGLVCVWEKNLIQTTACYNNCSTYQGLWVKKIIKNTMILKLEVSCSHLYFYWKSAVSILLFC